MLVKLKHPTKVFWEQSQEICLSGDKVFDVRSSMHIRDLLNSGELEEVESAKDAELSKQAKAKKKAAAESAKASKEAEDKKLFDDADQKLIDEAKGKSEPKKEDMKTKTPEKA